MHHLRCEALRGEHLEADTTAHDYVDKWPSRLLQEIDKPVPDLYLPAPTGTTLFPDTRTCRNQREHERLTTGERTVIQINNKVKLQKTNNSKHTYRVDHCSTLEYNIKQHLPSEAKQADLHLAEILFNSKIAQNTRQVNSSVKRTLTNLVPERDIFADPQPGDKDLLLVRMIQRKPNLCESTVNHHLKTHNSILLSLGIKPPPTTALYKGLAKGYSNRNFDARAKAQEPKRLAHTKDTMKLLAHAIGAMGPKHQDRWPELKVQAVFTATIVAFWSSARLSDLCGPPGHTFSQKTSLLEKDFRLMKRNGETIGLEVFFSSEKVQLDEGSKIQLPAIPTGPLRRLCPVRAYKKYQQLKAPLEPRASAPWLINEKGRPITRRALTTAVDYATNKAFSNEKQKHIFNRLTGHSFRPSLATHMQQMGDNISEEEQKLVGRWRSNQAFQRYRKDKTSARFNIAKTVINNLQH